MKWRRCGSALEGQGVPVLEAAAAMIPQSTVRVEGKDAAALLRLIEALEEQDDVQAVYSNYDIRRRGPRRHLRGLARCGSWGGSGARRHRLRRARGRWARLHGDRRGRDQHRRRAALEARLNAIHGAVHRLIDRTRARAWSWSRTSTPSTSSPHRHPHGARSRRHLSRRAPARRHRARALGVRRSKRAITGNGAAGKAQMQRRVQTLLGLEGAAAPIARGRRPRSRR